MFVLGSAAFALVLAHCLVIFLTIYKGYEVRAFELAFHLDLEGNIPTVFSTLMLFSIGLLSYLSYCHEVKEGNKDRFWFLLTFIFIFLAFDEGGQLHEKLINPFRGSMGDAEGAHGILYFAWVIPYGLASLALAIVLLRSLFQLRARTRNLFMISGAVYFTGAFGMELIGGSVVEELGFDAPLYIWLVTLEESFEICGTLLFIYTLLDHLKGHARTVQIEFS